MRKERSIGRLLAAAGFSLGWGLFAGVFLVFGALLEGGQTWFWSGRPRS